MTRNPREILNELMGGIGQLSETNPLLVKAFNDFGGAVLAEGAVNVKTKELISIGVSVYSRCEYCIVMHTYNALKAGANADEILEAGLVSSAFGGGPAFAYSITLLKQCIDEFSKDFQ
jgi:AhpD family alkylhydroperoxidase